MYEFHSNLSSRSFFPLFFKKTFFFCITRYFHLLISQYNPVSKATSYKRNSIPGSGTNFSFRHHVHIVNGTNQLPNEDLFKGVKWTERENHHAPQCNAKVKKAWSYISTYPTRLHSVLFRPRGNLVEINFKYTPITFIEISEHQVWFVVSVGRSSCSI